MSAFQFPDPALEQTVVNPNTGITYVWKENPGKWIVQNNHNNDQNDSIIQLQTDVADNTSDINDLKARPLPKDYMIGTDKNLTRIGTARSGPALELVDSEGYFSNVKFEATGGLTVTSSSSSIVFDASAIDVGAGDVKLSLLHDQSSVSIKVNGSLEDGVTIPCATQYKAGVLSHEDWKKLNDFENSTEYYTKDQIDNQFSLRGVGYNYLVSSFQGTITIRPGEIHTNNRLVGQITAISLGPEDDNGKQRRDAVAGDTIEIFDTITTKYYRYVINSGEDGTYSVTYQGSEAEQDDPLSIGQPYLIYLYPTHISSANYYDKVESDARFLSAKSGQMQDCQRGINLMAACEYTGSVQSSNNIVNKRYVDNAIADSGFASVQYVNDEVDKLATSFATEEAEPDVYYGDYAPTGTRKNGDLWFDAMNLRLNVFSQGAWINPDRNDGADAEDRLSALEVRIAQLESN